MPKTRPAYPEGVSGERRWSWSVKSDRSGCRWVAGGVTQSLRNWNRQDERDRGSNDDGLTSAEREALRELRKRVKRVEQEADIRKRATAVFARETASR